MWTSADNFVHLNPHEADTLLSSARWMQYCIRQGQVGGTPDEQRDALAQLQHAIAEISAQVERQASRNRTARWQGYAAAIAAVCATTVLIESCYLMGVPRTAVGLYIPVVIGIAMVVGRWPALLGCGLAFVLNDVLFVHPLRFSPSPDQIAALAVVALSCIALRWVVRAPVRALALLGIG
jgi:K+-sensing histidine kinase KdpD